MPIRTISYVRGKTYAEFIVYMYCQYFLTLRLDCVAIVLEASETTMIIQPISTFDVYQPPMYFRWWDVWKDSKYLGPWISNFTCSLNTPLTVSQLPWVYSFYKFGFYSSYHQYCMNLESMGMKNVNSLDRLYEWLIRTVILENTPSDYM